MFCNWFESKTGSILPNKIIVVISAVAEKPRDALILSRNVVTHKKLQKSDHVKRMVHGHRPQRVNA